MRLRNSSLLTIVALLGLSLGTLVMTGCALAGYGAYAIAGDTKTVDVPAQYTGLEGKYVAVIVAADEYLLYRYPRAPLLLSTAISARLAEHVDNVMLMNPQQIADFQRKNPYWSTLPYSELIKTLNVDRIVMVDLIDYRTREPGSKQLWNGVISGNLGVVDADASDPDHFVIYTPIRVQFPEKGVGVLESDQQTMELTLTALYGQKAAKLFYQHEEEVPH